MTGDWMLQLLVLIGVSVVALAIIVVLIKRM